MTFLNPVFFWSFVSLIPLALIYLLKVRPRRKPTTAYFLWHDIFQERRPNRLLQRLRDLWSLILMALAFGAICLALTRPEITEDDRKDILLLIDNSALMNTLHRGTSRLDAAKDAARGILRAFNGAQRAAVASVANEIEYRSHLTDNPRELIDAVDAIQPTNFELRPRPLALDAAEDKAWLEQQRVVLISDGCFDKSQLPGRVELLKIGENVDNVGLVSADLRRLPGSTGRLGLYVRLISTYASTINVDLLVYRGRTEADLFRLIPLEVEPGVNVPQVFNLEDATSSTVDTNRWRIQLDVDDALPNDDVAQLALPPHQPIRVQVATENRFFFENSVLAFSGDVGFLELVDENPNIVIHQGNWSSEDQPRGGPGAIVFQPLGESRWWRNLGDDLGAVVPKVLVEDHPILRHIDVASMSFVGAIDLTPPDKAQVLVASENDVPLIYRVSENGKTAIIANFDPVASDFYFSAWFPVLVHGSARHLAGREDQLLATYRPGDTIPMLGATEDGQTLVTVPDENTVELKSDRLESIDQVGFYQLKNENEEWTIASSMLSLQESSVDNAHTSDTSKPISRGWSMAHTLTVLAVLVLGIESVLYHRRKVG